MNNVFNNLPQHLDKELISTLLGEDNIQIERIVSKGHKSPESGWYDQEKNEWVMVLRGAAILEFEGRPPVSLKEGDYINLPSHLKHRVQWTDPNTETVWLAIYY